MVPLRRGSDPVWRPLERAAPRPARLWFRTEQQWLRRENGPGTGGLHLFPRCLLRDLASRSTPKGKKISWLHAQVPLTLPGPRLPVPAEVPGGQWKPNPPPQGPFLHPRDRPRGRRPWAAPPTMVRALCWCPAPGLQLKARSHSRASGGSASASDISNCSAVISAHPPKWTNKNQLSKGPP